MLPIKNKIILSYEGLTADHNINNNVAIDLTITFLIMREILDFCVNFLLVVQSCNLVHPTDRGGVVLVSVLAAPGVGVL